MAGFCSRLWYGEAETFWDYTVGLDSGFGSGFGFGLWDGKEGDQGPLARSVCFWEKIRGRQAHSQYVV